MTYPLKPLRAQILPKQVSPKPLPRNPTHNPDKQSRRLEVIKWMRISRPSWNPGGPPAPWWTRRRPRTARSASDSARTSKGGHGLARTGRVAARTQVSGAYGIEAVHGEHVDGGAAPSLRLAADALRGVHGVPGLRGVEHEEAAAGGRRRVRLRGRRRHAARARNPRPLRNLAAASKRVDEALQSLRPGHARSCRHCSRLPAWFRCSRAHVPASGIPLPFLFPAAAPVALPVASEEKKGGVPDLLAPAQPINGYQADLGLGLSLFFSF